MFSYELRQIHEGQWFLFGNLIYPHLELSCESQPGCEQWLSLGTRQGHQRMEAKPSRVFFTNKSCYPTPVHTVSLMLSKEKQTPTFPFIRRKLSSKPGKKNTTWGGDNWRTLGGGTKTSSSIGQVATQVVQQIRVVMYFIDWHIAALVFHVQAASEIISLVLGKIMGFSCAKIL